MRTGVFQRHDLRVRGFKLRLHLRELANVLRLKRRHMRACRVQFRIGLCRVLIRVCTGVFQRHDLGIRGFKLRLHLRELANVLRLKRRHMRACRVQFRIGLCRVLIRVCTGVFQRHDLGIRGFKFCFHATHIPRMFCLKCLHMRTRRLKFRDTSTRCLKLRAGPGGILLRIRTRRFQTGKTLIGRIRAFLRLISRKLQRSHILFGPNEFRLRAVKRLHRRHARLRIAIRLVKLL